MERSKENRDNGNFWFRLTQAQYANVTNVDGGHRFILAATEETSSRWPPPCLSQAAEGASGGRVEGAAKMAAHNSSRTLFSSFFLNLFSFEHFRMHFRKHLREHPSLECS